MTQIIDLKYGRFLFKNNGLDNNILTVERQYPPLQAARLQAARNA